MSAKVCKKCGAEKSIDGFPKNIKMPNGHLNACKQCEYARVASWRAANPDRVRANNERLRAAPLPSIPVGTIQKCKLCLADKPIGEFHACRGAKLGVRKTCKECVLSAMAEKSKADPAIQARNKAWFKNHPERTIELRAVRYQKNKATLNRKRGEFRLRHIDQERAREKRYLEQNRAAVCAKNGRRRAAETRSVPAWLTSIDKAVIQSFYEIAIAREMQTGIPHEIDHVVPLRNPTVSGLHVPWNLQVLTGLENSSKGNRFMCAGVI